MKVPDIFHYALYDFYDNCFWCTAINAVKHVVHYYIISNNYINESDSQIRTYFTTNNCNRIDLSL